MRRLRPSGVSGAFAVHADSDIRAQLVAFLESGLNSRRDRFEAAGEAAILWVQHIEFFADLDFPAAPCGNISNRLAHELCVAGKGRLGGAIARSEVHQPSASGVVRGIGRGCDHAGLGLSRSPIVPIAADVELLRIALQPVKGGARTLHILWWRHKRSQLHQIRRDHTGPDSK
jgi:hypothetical protein